jgi:predicted enzyme related to lactoylglutathione lyase
MTDTMTQTKNPTYAPGTPIWVDLGSPDLEASTRFYGQLFGWQPKDMGEAFGHYTMFFQDGKRVAAVGPLMSPTQPTAWSTYMLTTNAEDAAKKVTAAGGTVVSPPMAVMDEGTFAVFADPTGAVFSVWQPAKNNGAELFNTPNSMGWTELATRDMAAAKAFYTKVFPWTAKTNDMGGGQEYTEWHIDGRAIGGGMLMGSMYPPNTPAHWLVYFVVANTDATIKRAQELGAKLTAPAMDIPQGRLAVLNDPQGAAFAVMQLNK